MRLLTPITVVLLFLATSNPANAAHVQLTKPVIGTVTIQTDPPLVCGPGCTSATGTGEAVCDDYDPPGPPPRCTWDPLGLVATGDAGARFVGWSGCPQPSGTACWIPGGRTNVGAVVRAEFADAVKPVVEPPHSPAGHGPFAGLITLTGAGTDNVAVTEIEFRAGATILARVSPPFSATIDTRGLPDGALAITAVAFDAAGNASDPSPPLTVTIDNTPPTIAVVDGPTADPGTSNPSPTISFNPGDAATVRCSLDSESAFTACTTPVSQTFHGLPDGLHVLRIRAADALGNIRVIAHGFRVDTTPPITTIASGPDGDHTSQTQTRFEFASESGARLECRLDDATYRACSSPMVLTDLALGDHTLAVRAIDRVGNVEPVPAQRRWTVVADQDHDVFDRGPDCDDTDPAINPGAPDIPDDGVDQDCDGRDAINLDRDADGHSRPQDCNDGAPAIHPGAREVPRDRVDENCDGRDGDFPDVDADILHAESGQGDRTLIRRLTIVDPPAGGRVRIRCGGRGCTFRARSLALSGRGRPSLAGVFRRARLAPGAVVDVTVSAPDRYSKRLELRTRPGRPPSARWLRVDPRTGRLAPW